MKKLVLIFVAIISIFLLSSTAFILVDDVYENTIFSDYFLTFTALYFFVSILFLDLLRVRAHSKFKIMHSFISLLVVYVMLLFTTLLYSLINIDLGIKSQDEIDEFLRMLFVSLDAGVVSGAVMAYLTSKLKD